MSKHDKIKNFNPNAAGALGNSLFGLPFNYDESEIVVIPVPWEVTVSYSAGTAKGPEVIFDASFQVDLFDHDVKDAWKMGIFMNEIPKDIRKKSDKLREKARKYIDMIEEGIDVEKNKEAKKIRTEINEACVWLKEKVKAETNIHLKKNKLVCLLGGDHSTPLGFMEAISEKHPGVAILQIDAHADLRNAFEGFTYSHASIMYNAIQLPKISKLVQVGIRDYCEEEFEIIKSNKKVKTFFDHEIKRKQFDGVSWKKICDEIISELPEKVYISFDIDGLDPKLCPNTGTPVAGGFEFEQAVFLMKKIVDAGKKIVAFDLNEVAPGEDEWDGNVGARMLYKMANLLGKSNGVNEKITKKKLQS